MNAGTGVALQFRVHVQRDEGGIGCMLLLYDGDTLGPLSRKPVSIGINKANVSVSLVNQQWWPSNTKIGTKMQLRCLDALPALPLFKGLDCARVQPAGTPASDSSR